MPAATVTPEHLAARRARGEPAELIDVRTPAEFREIHAETARNVPLDRLTRGRPAGRAGVCDLPDRRPGRAGVRPAGRRRAE